MLEEAQPDLTIDPKNLVNASFANLDITDKYGNNVILNKLGGFSADAYIHTDLNILCGLPTTCLHYWLQIRKTLTATAQSVDCILQWVGANTLHIHTDNDFVYRLLDEPSKLRALKDLRTFLFDIDQSSFQKINVADFVDNLPALEGVRVDVSALTEAQANGFVQSQRQLKNWTIESKYPLVEFTKRAVDIEQ